MNWAQLFHVWLDAPRETLAVVNRGRKGDKVVFSSGRREREGLVIVFLMTLFQYFLHADNLVYFIN